MSVWWESFFYWIAEPTSSESETKEDTSSQKWSRVSFWMFYSSLERNLILYTVQEPFTAEYPSHALHWIIINEFSLMEFLLDQKYELH